MTELQRHLFGVELANGCLREWIESRCRCSREIGLVPSGDYTGRANIFIRTLSASAQIVTMLAEWKAGTHGWSGEKANDVRCASTGVFEKRFYETLQQSLD